MKKWIKNILVLSLIIVCIHEDIFSQCILAVDTNSINHDCAGNGNGSAMVINNATYLNFSWQNLTNGQNYGNGINLTSINNLDQGTYVVTGTSPYLTCSTSISLTDTFEIVAPIPFSLSISTTTESCSPGNDGTAIVSVLDTSSVSTGGTVNYCASEPTQNAYSNIELVSLTGNNFSINNNTSGLCDRYEDYTSQFADVTPGQTYNMQINLGSCNSIWFFQDAAKVFVDWNIDGDFSDVGEEIQLIGATQSPSSNSFSFTVPANAVGGGSTRMRVVAQNYTYNGNTTGFNACDSLVWFGATEDYTILVSGGGSVAYPLTYLWSNGATTDSIYGLAAGTYTVTVTDAYGCSTTDTAIVSVGGMSNTINLIDTIKCFGDLATIQVITQNGDGWYNYSLEYWDPMFGGLWLPLSILTTYDTATFPFVPANNYRVTVTDISTSCINHSFITISEPSQLSATSIVTDVTNCTTPNGSINLTVSGGVHPYSFLWSTGDTTEDISSLAAGSYNVDISDTNGCLITETIIINLIAPLSVTTLLRDTIKCYGDLATIDVIITCGNGWNYYELDYWSPMLGGIWLPLSNQTTYDSTSFLLVPASNFRITVTDLINNSTATSLINITQPSLLIGSITSQTDVSCNGFIDGTATVSASGGTPGYSYAWNTNPVQTTATATTLAAGTYICTITDANGCIAYDTATITEPLIISTTISSTPATCGLNDGSISLSISGGVPSYTFLWSDGSTTQNLSNLSSGSYTVIVTDAYGCTVYDTVIVGVSGNLHATTMLRDTIQCYGDLATIDVLTSCGSGWYHYALQYFSPMFGGIWLPLSTQTTYDSATFISVPAFNYRIVVTDQSNNTNSIVFINITQPSAIIAVSTHTDVSCNGGNDGTATVSVSGGTPGYSYLWNTTPTQTIATATALAAGTYTCTITDANGCVTTHSDTIFEPSQLTGSITSQTNVSCNGLLDGSVTITAAGGSTTYQYDIGNGSQPSGVFGGLSAGNYTIIITDNNSCTTNVAVIITEPNVLTGSIIAQTNVSCNGLSDGSITMVGIGGSPTYQYDIGSGPQSSGTFTALAAGTYICSIIDANGCSTTDTLIITEPTTLNTSSNLTNVSCFGGNDASITLYIAGGTIDYIVSAFGYTLPLSGGLDSITSSNLPLPNGVPAGAYPFIVTDANGCSITDTVIITQPAVLAVSSTTQPVSCYGLSDGTATVNVSGGTLGYSYSWNTIPTQTTATATALAAGTYICTITDANICTTTHTVTIIQPISIVGSIIYHN